MYLNLGLSIAPKDFKLFRIEDVDFESTVDNFKSRVAEKVNFLKENIGKKRIIIISLVLIFVIGPEFKFQFRYAMLRFGIHERLIIVYVELFIFMMYGGLAVSLRY